MDLVVAIYTLTRSLPADERFSLVSQMRRSAMSIPCNFAEGRLRGSDREFNRFLRIALGSLAELETQVEIARRLHHLDEARSAEARELMSEVARLTEGLRAALRAR